MKGQDPAFRPIWLCSFVFIHSLFHPHKTFCHSPYSFHHEGHEVGGSLLFTWRWPYKYADMARLISDREQGGSHAFPLRTLSTLVTFRFCFFVYFKHDNDLIRVHKQEYRRKYIGKHWWSVPTCPSHHTTPYRILIKAQSEQKDRKQSEESSKRRCSNSNKF